MTYVLSDDKTFRQVALRLAGKDAAFLYELARHECAAGDCDGVLTPLLIKDAAGLYDLNAKRLTPKLIEAGVWHTPEQLAECGDCLEYTEHLQAPDLLLHEWWKPLLHKDGKEDPVKRQRETRRKALNRDKKLVAAIRNRDKDVCRYCGVLTLDSSGPDKKSRLIRTLDHIDPWGDNTYGNVVVACRACNGWKRDRTPADWLAQEGPWSPQNPGGGRPLLKPGTRSDANPADPTHNPAADPAPSRSARETGPIRIGPGQDGPGTGPGPDREPAHASNGHTNGART